MVQSLWRIKMENIGNESYLVCQRHVIWQLIRCKGHYFGRTLWTGLLIWRLQTDLPKFIPIQTYKNLIWYLTINTGRNSRTRTAKELSKMEQLYQVTVRGTLIIGAFGQISFALIHTRSPLVVIKEKSIGSMVIRRLLKQWII